MSLKKVKEELIEVANKHALYQNILKTNGKIVIGKGSQTPEYLFLGEAPGFTENQQGAPFVGRSGKLLDAWVQSTNITNYAVINAVPIIPLNEEGKIRAPTTEEIDYFRPFVKKLIDTLQPKYIICVGKTASQCLEIDFKLCEWQVNIGCIYHPSYYMRNGQDGVDDFNLLCNKMNNTFSYVKEILEIGKETKEVINDFLKKINANYIDENCFMYNEKKWYINYRPFDKSDDIIIPENNLSDYDYFLLVKSGQERTKILGYTDRQQLTSVPARDIYRNGSNCFVVVDTNIKDLSYFKIQKEMELQKIFSINIQTAENLGHTEMISGLLSGLHYFAKKANLYFKDINQNDECILGNKKVKIYTRDALMDEDMLIHEEYYQKHPEIELFILCKKKAGMYNYLGYIVKDVVEKTRVVQMIGEDSTQASSDIRRIFAEQYKPLSDLIKIYQEEKEDEKISELQNYIPLNIHSEFSIGDAYGTIPHIVNTLYKKGFKSGALTDLGTMAGLWVFQKAMLEKNLKPILGIQAYMILPNDEKRYELVLLIKNEKGWKNLLQLQALAVRDNFYYKPRMPIEKIIELSEGLICVFAGSNSPLFHFINRGENKKAKENLTLLKNAFGNDLYLQITPQKLNGHQFAIKAIHNLSLEFNIQCFFSPAIFYPEQQEQYLHDATLAISKKKKYGEVSLEENEFFLMQDKDIKLSDELEWMEEHIDTWKKNTFEIVEKCNFKIQPPKENDTLPKFLPTKEERKELLQKLVHEGLPKYTPYQYENVKNRLDLELNRRISKEYENYFLIVWDLIKWAKDNGIRVGPGRGSVGASLVAFALNITECDPIKYDLLFDRFLSEIRRDMPDADLDFMDTRREEIFTYFKSKYGENHNAKVITYARFHPRGILRDVGRIFDIPDQEINKMCNLCIQRSGGDARASFGLIDTFSEFREAQEFQQKYPLASDVAIKLEAHIRHKGIHAAAAVLAEKDISSYLPITKVNGEITTEWEKQLVEDMKLVKFDILGLKTLTVIDEAMKLVNCQLPINFDDENIYKNVFQNGNTLGVFQFEQVGMTKMATAIGIKSFNELYDATTLYRPGALHCLSGDSLILTKRGDIRIDQLKPNDKIKCYIKDGNHSRFEYKLPKRFGTTGENIVYEIETEHGKIKATSEHKFLTKNGYKKVEELTDKDEILMCINPSKTKFKKDDVPFNKGLKGFLSKERLGK